MRSSSLPLDATRTTTSNIKNVGDSFTSVCLPSSNLHPIKELIYKLNLSKNGKKNRERLEEIGAQLTTAKGKR